MWEFFSKFDIILAVFSLSIGVLGFFGFTFNVIKKGKKCRAVVIALVTIISFTLGFLWIYFRGMQAVPDINRTSYEVAQQMLENKNIKYSIVNKNEYNNIELRNTIVTLNNVHSKDIIHNNFVVELRIVGIVNKSDENESKTEISTEDSTKKNVDIEGPFTDVFISFKEVLIYQILENGSKSPLIDNGVEIKPNELILHNKDYDIDYGKYSYSKDGTSGAYGAEFSSLPCGHYTVKASVEGYFDIEQDISIYPDELHDERYVCFLVVNSKKGGELVPFNIQIFNESNERINGESEEITVLLKGKNESDLGIGLDVTSKGTVGMGGLKAAINTEFDITIWYNNIEYSAQIKLKKEEDIIVVLKRDGTLYTQTASEYFKY